MKLITGMNIVTRVFEEKKTKYKRLPVTRAEKAVFNCQEETSVELIGLIEVINKSRPKNNVCAKKFQTKSKGMVGIPHERW